MSNLPTNWYDVTNYGVTTGNSGATNNTNLANLLNNVAPSSSVIYFPAGFFPFASTITIPAKIFNFIGSGAGLSGSQSAFYWTSNVAGDLIALTAGNWYTQFRDIGFITSVTQTAGAAINVMGNAGINFTNCLFTGLSSSTPLYNCIRFDGPNGADETFMYNCVFTNFSSTAIVINSTNSTLAVLGGTINGGGTGNVGIGMQQAAAIQIVNMDIIGCTNNLLMNPGTGNVVASVLCDNTYFDNSGGACLKITGAGATVRSKFSQCTFTVGSSASPATGIEISSTYTSSTGTGIDFINCDLINTYGSTGVGTAFNFTSGAGDIRIESCNISNWATGINVTPASLAGMTKLTIVNNDIGQFGGYAGNTTGINLLAGSAAYGSILIDNNTMIGNTTNIIDASSLGTGTAQTGFKLIGGNSGLITPNTANYAATTIATGATNVDSRGGWFIPIGAGNGTSGFRGASLRITVSATNTNTAQTLTTTLRYGTNNSSSDTAILTQAFTAGTGTAGSGLFVFEVDFETATTMMANLRFFNGNNAATGIAGVSTLFTGLTTPATISTSANNWLGVYFASTTNAIITIRSVKYEVISQ